MNRILYWRLESCPGWAPWSLLIRIPCCCLLTCPVYEPIPGSSPEGHACIYRIIIPDTTEALYLISKDPKSVLAPHICALCSPLLPKLKTWVELSRLLLLLPNHNIGHWPYLWHPIIQTSNSSPTPSPLIQTLVITYLERCRAYRWSHWPQLWVLGPLLPAPQKHHGQNWLHHGIHLLNSLRTAHTLQRSAHALLPLE